MRQTRRQIVSGGLLLWVACAGWVACTSGHDAPRTDLGDPSGVPGDEQPDAPDGGGDASVGVENTNALCSDGVSNDGDKWIDCDDHDCSQNPVVAVCRGVPAGAEATQAACGNGLDDDGDGKIDGDDFGCCRLALPSLCPVHCASTLVTLAVSGAQTAELTVAATFSDARPAMWQLGNADERLVYSDVSLSPSYRSRSREYGIDFDLPALPGGFEAKLKVEISAASAAHWNVILVDSALASAGCGVGAAGFGLSGASASSSQTFEFTQPGFPYPALYQSGSHITLMIAEVADAPAALAALPDAAQVRVTYAH